MRFDDRSRRVPFRCFVVLAAMALLVPVNGQEAALPPTPALDVPRQAEVDRLFEQLASPEFAQRERAAADLMTVGLDVVPQLKRLVEESGDAEVRLRAGQIVRQLTQGDLQTRIDDFLAGREVEFQGWDEFRLMMGDNGAIRELFIEFVRTHPELLTSLEGTTRDRVIAMEKTISTVQQRMFVEGRFPTRADTFALVILAAYDVNVPITVGYESVLLSTLHKEAASKIRQDARLAPAMEALLGRCLIRSTLDSRIDMLLAGMQWNINETLPLAKATLSEATQTETLAVAMQAFARFGSKNESIFVEPFLQDSRPATEMGFADGKTIRAELRDIAMVTIAILHHANLNEVGVGNVSTHPVYGFDISSIGFPIEDEAPRKKARENIDALIKRDADVEGL